MTRLPSGTGFLSAQEGFDTTTSLARLLVNLLASLAEFELELIRERVMAGMERAKAQRKAIGRPRIADGPDFKRRWNDIVRALDAGAITVPEAARRLQCSVRTVRRLRATRRAEPPAAG